MNQVLFKEALKAILEVVEEHYQLFHIFFSRKKLIGFSATVIRSLWKRRETFLNVN